MTGELIIFPVRVGVRATRCAVRVGLRVTTGALSLGAHLARAAVPDTAAPDTAAPDEAGHEQPIPARASEIPARAPEIPTRAPEIPARAPDVPRARERRPQPEPPPPPEAHDAPPAPALARPDHVSEESTLVEEFAEPGAEEGAGAQVRVDEPWKGYRRLGAADVLDRVRGASAAELAAVQLYEGAHRRRQSVLAAVRRELRAAGSRVNSDG